MDSLALHDLLTPEEELVLLKLAQSGDLAARNEIVRKNIKLVMKFIQKNIIYKPEDYMDLVQEGAIGLMTAIDKFDFTYKTRFATYATHWIKEAIYAYLQNNKTIRIPYNVVSVAKIIKRTQAEFANKHNRGPTIPELSEILNMTPEKIDSVTIATLEVVSTNGSMDSPDGFLFNGPFIRQIPISADKHPEQILNIKINHEILNEIINDLTWREKEILERRFGLNNKPIQTLSKVGSILDLSRERIRQIEVVVLDKIRKRIVEKYDSDL